MYQINTKKLHTDILKKLNEINKPQRYLPNKIGVSRMVLWRIQNNGEITMKTFLRLLDWLDKEPGRYIKWTKNK